MHNALIARFRVIPAWVWLVLLTAALLLPFINKAVHIDDTLFLRAAEQIQRDPIDFYGGHLNWVGVTRPMTDNFHNPPLASFYLALVAALFGWREPALHLAFLLCAVAAVWGIYRLAGRFCRHPGTAAALALVMPVFLVSATSLMCDVMLLAFWAWAVFFFDRGLERDSRADLLAGGLLAGLGFCVKFPALALVPLLATYGFCRKQRFGWWLGAACIPLLFVGAYEWSTTVLYGKGLFHFAAAMSSHARSQQISSIIARQFVGLSYLGGCFLPALFAAPLLWSTGSTVRGLLVIVPCVLVYPYFGEYVVLWEPDGSPNWLLCLQSSIFIVSGLHVLLLAVNELGSPRNAASFLLFLWIVGIFVFATSVNWTLNGRSLLPMTPAVVLLILRQLERRFPAAGLARSPSLLEQLWWPPAKRLAAQALAARKPPQGRKGLAMLLARSRQMFEDGSAGLALLCCFVLLPATGLSLIVSKADRDFANSARTAAQELCAKYARPGRTLWFEGHWGFQYYMENHGARPLERKFLQPDRGDYVIVPWLAPCLFDFPTNYVRLVDCQSYLPNPGCSLMSLSAGAGFYGSMLGPFPFSCGNINPQRYYVFEVTGRASPLELAQLEGSEPGAVGRQLQLEGVITQRRSVLRARPHDLALRLELADLLTQQQRRAEAIEQYRAALASNLDSVRALTALAWLLATDPDSRLRHSHEALQLAERADALTGHQSPKVLTALGAAYANAGQFEKAIAAASRAADLARTTGQVQVADTNEQLLRLYCANRTAQ